ncbi:hypothetical protein V8E36_008437 [Tilletia maclaganii]
MRACLENNNHVTRRQVKRIASAIILHAVPLSTNANGALLLTWLLDTSGLPARYRLLAPRFAPHLAQLCTHKLSSLTIWRIVSQKTDMAASRLILDALFGKADAAENDEGSHPEQANRAKEALPLEEILLDQMHGATFVAKVLGSPAVEAARTDGVPEKPRYVEMVRKILVRNRLVGASAYRRVLEEVGMAESLPIAPASAAASSAPRTAPAPTLASHAQNPSTTFGISSSLAAPRLPSLPPMPQGAPTVPDTGRAPSMVPHGMLAAAAAGNQAALHDLASLGMLPHGLMTGLPPPGAMGMNFDAVELNGMMSQMQLNPALYGSNGLPIPPAGMLGHGSASHLGSGHRGPLGPPLGNGNGQGPHSGAGAFESFSMSPEQAVGSGVLSPPPAPRMGWPVQPQGLQLHQQMPVPATPQQQPSSINPMAQFNLWEPPELPHTGSFGRSPTRSSRPAPIGRGLGGSFGATLPRR